MNIVPKSIESYKINASNKITTLNPNAAEFVPSALQSPSGNTKGEGSAIVDSTRTSGKSILDHSESSISNISYNSDDEARQYWHHQLPDDITPDFKVIGEDGMPNQGQLSLAGLSIRDGIEPSRFSASMARETFGTQRRKSLGANDFSLSGNMGYSGSNFTKDQASAACIVSAGNSWDKHFVNGDQQFTRGMEGKHFNGKSSASFLNRMLGGQDVINDAIDPVECLTSQFPGYSAESLADMYYANGCDLNLTMEMLGHLELQAVGGFSRNLNSKSLSVPSLNKLGLQSLSMAESHGRLPKYTQDLQRDSDAYRSTANLFQDATSFASAARKFSPIASSSLWKHEKNGSADGIIGSSRSSQLLASSFNGHGKFLYGDKVPSPDTSRIAPNWLDTGEAMENIHSESREEARQLAHLRNACLEQASQAYLLGNKTLARELSEKGHLYNMQLKAAQMKAGDTIYRKRDPISYELQGYNRGIQDRLIDLHGLHVSDALHVLKHELDVLRSTAGSSRHRPQATVFLGTGKTARASPRLPMAVEQFLLEEGLTYTQPQPGLLHVVIY